jgi:hypothetical protein
MYRAAADSILIRKKFGRLLVRYSFSPRSVRFAPSRMSKLGLLWWMASGSWDDSVEKVIRYFGDETARPVVRETVLEGPRTFPLIEAAGVEGWDEWDA